MKQIWIINHYATRMYYEEAGRHYWFAEHLSRAGFKPVIFCASTVHNSDKYISTGIEKYAIETKNGIDFVFIKTPRYKGNGMDRIKNMVMFYRNIIKVSKKYARLKGNPDVVYSSSVHPLALVAGLKIAKREKVKCICEVRDLWPETLVDYGKLEKKSTLTKLLYKGEKWIYKKADQLIFTMEGGKDYIKEKGWSLDQGGPIDLNKVHHITNGIDIDVFNSNKKKYQYDVKLLNENGVFKVIYAGSIRTANNVEFIVDTAEVLMKKGIDDVKFLIYGDGPDKTRYEQLCKDKGITNVLFRGFIDKKYIPYVLSKADVNVLNYKNASIWKYGGSQNKLSEYIVSGKPIISTISMNYDPIIKYNCRVSM